MVTLLPLYHAKVICICKEMYWKFGSRSNIKKFTFFKRVVVMLIIDNNAYHWEYLQDLYLSTVKLANSASPFKFCQVKILCQAGLENDKMCFS